jgi:HK97 gp10 family phage protein
VAPERISIDGLREFNKALKEIDSKLPSQTRIGLNTAAQIVVDAAKPKVPVGPGKGGHAKDSIKAKSTRTEVRVSEGGNKYPYMPWLDFGGRVGIHKSVKRPFMKTGRYLWAAYDAHKGDVEAQAVKALEQVAVDAGLTPSKVEGD